MKPFFSIIIPTCNSAKVLGGAIDSILKQTFKDFEIVIIDNESIDRTLSIINSYGSGKIIVYFGKDSGIYDAMNKGVVKSKGKWIYFLGSDDKLYDKGVLQRVNEVLNVPEVDLLYGNVIMKSNNSVYAGEFNLIRLLEEGNICHQSIFFSRDVFTKVGPFNLKYKIWADWDFNIRCFKYPGLRIKYVDLIVANYDDRHGASKVDDDVLYRELPLYYKKQFYDYKHKYEKLLAAVRNQSVYSAFKKVMKTIGDKFVL